MSWWYRVEMWCWVPGMMLQGFLVFRLLRTGRFRKSPLFFTWLLYDLIFSLVLYAVNQAGGEHTAYPRLWGWMQPVDVWLLGAAVLEAIGAANLLGFLLLASTYLIGIVVLADGERQNRKVLIACALVSFVGSAALALYRRGLILMIYLAAQVVQHLSVLWRSPRWHAGAYVEVVSCCCFAAWIVSSFRRFPKSH